MKRAIITILALGLMATASFADAIKDETPISKFSSHSDVVSKRSDCLNRHYEDQIPPAPDDADDESQCGDSIDWQDVELYDGQLGPSKDFVQNNERPVGEIVWNDDLDAVFDDPGNVNGTRWCSGTLISDNMFLTAGHCFDVKPNDQDGWDFPIDNGTGEEITSDQAAQNMHVSFNYQLDGGGNLRSEIEVPIVALMEYRLGAFDYAIVQLADAPGQTFGTATIRDDTPNLNDQLTIIQHPSGLPKVVDAGNYDGIEPDDDDLAGYMKYTDLDTAGGSSGSGVLNDSEKLIGVHTNAGCTVQGGANHGVLINDIAPESLIINNLLSFDDPTAIQGNFGIPGNLEMLIQQGGQLCHWYRSGPHFPWRRSTCFGDNVFSSPALIQSNFGTTGNFEVLVRQGDEVCHWYRYNDDPNFPWRKSACFGDNVSSAPVLIQGNFGNRGNFEALVRQGEEMCHWYRDNDDPRFPWRKSACFGDNVSSAPALIQGNFGNRGNFEVLVRQGEEMCHWYRDNDDPRFPWRRSQCFGDNVSSTPALIQSNFGDKGNFEVLVRQGEKVCHWYRDNDNPRFPWRRSQCFGENASSAPVLIQGSFGDQGNFEALVRQSETMCHWYRDNDDPRFPWRRSECFGEGENHYSLKR